MKSNEIFSVQTSYNYCNALIGAMALFVFGECVTIAGTDEDDCATLNPIVDRLAKLGYVPALEALAESPDFSHILQLGIDSQMPWDVMRSMLVSKVILPALGGVEGVVEKRRKQREHDRNTAIHPRHEDFGNALFSIIQALRSQNKAPEQAPEKPTVQ